MAKRYSSKRKPKPLPFIKMHGAGNDFVFLSRKDLPSSMTKGMAQFLLDRHFGIGGDQLLLLDQDKKSQRYELQIYNNDGSRAEMCGNGVRAVAAYLKNHRGVKKDFVIRTKAGLIGIGFRNGSIEVDMGEPIFEGALIPVNGVGPILDYPLSLLDRTFLIHGVSMGNPHAVIFVEDVGEFPVKTYGPLIENHAFFPRRTNVEFVQVIDSRHIRARVWERGAGETLACGTGACAMAVASARVKKTEREVKIDLPGGQLGVRWGENNHVYLSGPAEVVYEGEIYV